MRVKKLSTPEEFERYVDFGKEVYRDNPYWAPPDKHHLVKLLGGEAGFGPQSEIQPFAVEHEDRTLATVAAVKDEDLCPYRKQSCADLLLSSETF